MAPKVYGYVSDFTPPSAYVYFIADGHGYVKIGMANDIRARLDALQTANPHKLELYVGLKIPNGKMSEARKIEKQLHKMFEADRIRGEWFKMPNITKYLKQPRIELCGYVFKNIDKLVEDYENDWTSGRIHG